MSMKIYNEKTVVNFSFPKPPEKEGYLLKKRSENKRSFKRRYFVLHGNILIYSETRLSKEPLGVLFLEGHSVELVDERMFAIHFHTSCYTGRSFVLQAETDFEAESWMQALAHCGSEFLTLSVEELEDALRALSSLADNGVANNNVFKRNNCSSHQVSPGVHTRNPFNIPPSTSSGGRRERSQQPNDRSISHLIGLLALSWEKMHASAREYLDNVAVSEGDGESLNHSYL